MASIAQLSEIADRNRPATDARSRGLMQNAIVRQNTGVELHGTASNESDYEYAAGRDKKNPNKIQTHSSSTVIENNTSTNNIATLDHQTEVMRDQQVATQKQVGILDRQSGLMQEQIRATHDVSEVVQRLYEYMKAENSKPVPKVQDIGSGRGHTYEGEFTRVPNGQNGNEFNPFGALEEINDLRNRRSERARNQPRDKRGRFKRAGSKAKGWRLPKAGKLLKAGGILGGGLMVADGLMDISDHEGDGLFEGGISSRAGGYAQSIGGGAMTGAAVGSIVPVIGTAVGAAVGAALGGLGALMMDNKQAISNGYARLMGQPQDSRALGRSDAQSKDIADAAMTKDLGAVSQGFESGGRGVATISTGKGDAGGASYGAHQLSSKSGTMTAFLRSEQGSKYYNEFRGMQPGTKEFNDKYTEIVKKDGAGMEAAQKDFITKTHYSPVAKWFQEQYGMDLEQHSRALKEALYSVGVQYGAGGAKKLIAEAYDGLDVAKTDDSQLIQKLQDYRASSVNAKFSSSSGDVRQSVAGRARDENVALQKMLTNERSGQMGGSGIGSQYSSQMINAYGGKATEQGGRASNGTVGIMPMQAGGGGGTSGAGDEAGGGTAAAELNPADGALYNLGMKHVRPNDNSVNMSGLNPKFKQAFYTMVGDWVQNNGGTVVNVASAFRTRMEQEKLWVKYGRNTKRVARPGTSRHESGFAIDIDRNSAASMERAGLFKKYGFHRPLSNEPWHVEMIGAGKGGAPGGAPVAASAAASPQVMQQAAAQEMDKAAESTVQTAEENTRAKVADAGAGGGAPTDAETKPNGAVEQNADAAAQEVKTDAAKPATVNMPANDPTPPMVNADGASGRTPEQQAIYEQYLKAAGGDPRGVPTSVQTGAVVAPANPQSRYSSPQFPSTGNGSWGNSGGGYGGGYGGNGLGIGGTAGDILSMGGVSVSQTSETHGGKIEVAPGVSIGGGITVPGAPNVHIPTAQEAVRNYENAAISKVMGMIPQMPRLSVMKGGVGIDAGVNVGNPFSGGGPISSLMKGNSIAPMAAPESPASSSYYRNETPVATRAAAPSAQAIPMSVATVAKPEKVEQQKFDTVQQVAIADAGAMAGPSAPAPTGGGGAPKAGEKNDLAQLEEIPAIMEDLGILFINMGYV